MITSPWSISFFAPVATPRSIRPSTPSVIIPVWKPRSAWPDSAPSTAFGRAPTPIWTVSPSSISAATSSPMARSAASGSRAGASRSGRSVSIVAAKADSGSRVAPLVRGIWRLTSAISVGV